MSDKNFKVKNGIDAVGPITISPLSNATNGLIINTPAGGRAITFNREGSNVGSIDDWGTYNGSGINIIQPWYVRSPGLESQSFFWVGTGARSVAGFGGTNSGTNPVIYISSNGSATNDLTQWIKSDNTVLTKIDYLGQITSNSHIINSTTASTVGLVVKSAASQSTDLQQWQNSSGSSYLTVSNFGAILSSGGTTIASNPTVNAYGAAVKIASGVYSYPMLILQGAASQTADIQKWQNSAGTDLVRVSAAGKIIVAADSESANSMITTSQAAVGQQVLSLTSTSADYGLTINATGAGSGTSVGIAFSAFAANGYNGVATPGAAMWFTRTGSYSVGYLSLLTRYSTGANDPLVERMRVGDTGTISIAGFTSSSTGLIVKSAASQTANLQEWQDSSGNVLSYIRGYGGAVFYDLGIRGSAGGSSAWAYFGNDSVSTKNIVVRAANSQTANMQEWQDSGSNVLASISSTGTAVFGRATQVGGSNLTVQEYNSAITVYNTDNINNAIKNKIFFVRGNTLGEYGVIAAKGDGNNGVKSIVISNASTQADISGFNLTGGIYTNLQSASAVGLIIKGATSQTANLTEWQNSSGTVLTSIGANGSLISNVQGSATSLLSISQEGGTKLEINQYGQSWNSTRSTFGSYYNTDGGTLPQVSVLSGAADVKGLIVRGAISQTANLQEWQNSSGSVLSSITKDGTLDLRNVSTQFTNTGTGSVGQKINLWGGSYGIGIENARLVNYIPSTSYFAVKSSYGGADLFTVSGTGSATLSSDLTISGNLTVNGTTTNLNSTNLVIEDKNIIIADVATPTDTTADGAGITIKGATDKTLNWVQSTGRFTSSESFEIAKTNARLKINSISSSYTSGIDLVVSWNSPYTDITSKIFFDFYGDSSVQTITGSTGGHGMHYVSGRSGFGNHWFRKSTTDGVQMAILESGSVGINTTTPTSALQINSLATGTIALIVKGISSQANDLQQWQNSSGTTLANVDSNGYIRTPLVEARPTNAGLYGIAIAANASQSGDLFQITDASNNAYTGVSSTGKLVTGNTTNASRFTQITDAALGQLTVYSPTASTKSIVIRAASSQTANLTEWQGSDGNALALVNSSGAIITGGIVRATNGGIFGGTSQLSTALTVYAQTSGQVGAIIRGAASQTANLLEFQDSTGTVSASYSIGTNGLYVNNNAALNGVVGIGGSSNTGWQLGVINYLSAPGRIGMIVRGAASQSANLQEWQNSAGGVLAYVANDGTFQNTGDINSGSSIRLGSGATSSGGYPVFAMKNATVVPTSNPTAGGVLYVESGALKYRGQGGAITTIAASSVADQEDIENSEVQLIQYGAEGSVLQNLPTRIHPAEQLLKEAVFWLDPAHSSAGAQTIKNLGWGGTALDATAGANTSVSTDEPKYLSWEGENYIYATGETGNYLMSSTSASLGMTTSSDLDMRIKISLDSLSGLNQYLISTWWYRLSITNGGYVSLGWQDGSTFNYANSTSLISTVATVGQPIWIRGTLKLNNGAGGYEIKFYTSKDNVTWTQLGNTITGASTSTLGSGGQSLAAEIGSLDSGVAYPVSGKIYRAQILNGIDGTVVFDCDTSLVTSGSATTFNALTGHTMTITRNTIGRKMVAVTHPLWLFGTDDYLKVSDNNFLDFTANQPFTIFLSARQFASTAGTTTLLGKGIYGGWAGYTIVSANSTEQAYFSGPQANSSYYYSGDLGKTTALKNYFYGRSVSNTFTYIDNNLTTGSVEANAQLDTSNSYNLYLGRQENGQYSNMEMFGVAIWRRALTATEISTISKYYEGRAI